jgi:hypothetical protein
VKAEKGGKKREKELFLGDTREEIDHPPDNEYCILYIFIMRKIETAISIILVNLVKDLAK